MGAWVGRWGSEFHLFHGLNKHCSPPSPHTQCYESISNNVGAQKGIIPDWMTPAGTFYNQVREQ